ncbi:MAG: hypothetical protein KDA24_14050 [Deltaproteobacteria bacterium]|nr:hypothetical protein [Deltaproteobacteria bacterium]
MESSSPIDVVLSLCRFVCKRADLDRLMPGFEFEIPVPQDLGPAIGTGWPLRPPRGLTAALYAYVATQVKAHMKPGAQVEAEGYFPQLEAALFDAVAQAPGARLDTIVWLWLLDIVPRLLQGDAYLLGQIEADHPALVAKHRAPLDQLQRLAGRNPAQHATLLRKVLVSIDAGHELVASDLRQRAGEASEHLLALAGDTPVLQLVGPHHFYYDLDLAPIFLGREGFVDGETLEMTRHLVEAVIEATSTRRGANRAGPGERWALGYFAHAGLIARAEVLEAGSLPEGVGDDMAVRIAALGALQADFVDYVLHHADQFSVDPLTAARHGVKDEQLGLLADPEMLSLRAAGYRDVVDELLRWDALNATRSLVRVVALNGSRYVCDGEVLGDRAFVLDLEAAPSPTPAPAPASSRFEALDGPSETEHPLFSGDFGNSSAPSEDFGAFSDLFASSPNLDLFESGDAQDHVGHYEGLGISAAGTAGLAAPPAAPVLAGPPAVSREELSLLGVLHADFADLLREYDLGLRSLPPQGVTEARVEKPDFATLFEDYMIFPVGRLGARGSAIGIARRHRDQLFDLHLFPVPQDPAWRPEQAVDDFMRAKVSANFVPLAFEYSDIPEGSGSMEPLTPRRLERAFNRVARPDLERT